MTTAQDVLADLVAEQQALDDIVAGATGDQLARPTASEGWTVADQIAHLAYFDRAAAVAIADPAAFQAMANELWEAAGSGDEGIDDLTLGSYRTLDPPGLIGAWRRDRDALASAASGLGDDDRIEWYGPSMGSKSFLTARLMECWAHGQDVVDALGAVRRSTDRLGHICRLGFITRGWSYANRGEDPPPVDVRVELVAPSGAIWSFGADDAPESIVGSAEDFCLVVTQRRHVDDTELVASGSAGRDWMLKAQAFAGPPTTGPTPKVPGT